ncbi:MAG: HPr family phosphocarrier protein [Nitriliruptorales bacterium]|nr:HPr family phosphocarrier protein [Nitriliruptorales bacterium]
METSAGPVTNDVVVGSRVGLHARPAALVAQAAAAQPVIVQIAKDGAPVQARSVLSLISLGAKCGDTVTLSAEGDGAPAAVAALAELIARDLDAE